MWQSDEGKPQDCLEFYVALRQTKRRQYFVERFVWQSQTDEKTTQNYVESFAWQSQTRRKHKILWSVLCSEDEILRDKDNELKILWRVLCGRTRLTRRQTFWAEFCVTETGEENTQDSLESFCGPKSWRFLCMLKRNR